MVEAWYQYQCRMPVTNRKRSWDICMGLGLSKPSFRDDATSSDTRTSNRINSERNKKKKQYTRSKRASGPASVSIFRISKDVDHRNKVKKADQQFTGRLRQKRNPITDIASTRISITTATSPSLTSPQLNQNVPLSPHSEHLPLDKRDENPNIPFPRRRHPPPLRTLTPLPRPNRP
jgi:hypothetical protein